MEMDQASRAFALLCVMALSSVLLNAFLLYYIVDLDHRMGCQCAKNWRRDFLYYYFLIMIIIVFVQFVSLFTPARTILAFIITPITIILNLMFIIIALQYINNLKAIKCKCSEDFARNIMQIIAIIGAIAYSCIGLFLLASLILFLIYKKRIM